VMELLVVTGSEVWSDVTNKIVGMVGWEVTKPEELNQ